MGSLRPNHSLISNHVMEHKGHSLYRRWKGMRSRCNNVADKKYPLYGARGIKVDSRWTTSDDWCGFCAFVKDMGIPPKGRTLDRTNNDGNYEPSNCRWATYSEQNHNQRLKPSNRTGAKGVHESFTKDGIKVWSVTLDYKGKRNYLGRFYELSKAVTVRQEKARDLGLQA